MVNNINILINYTSWVYDLTNRQMAALRGHKYHILPLSSAPITISFALLFFLLTLIFNFHGSKINLLYFEYFIQNIINFFNKKIFSNYVNNYFFFRSDKIITIINENFITYGAIHLFWLSSFLITLGVFFLWSSNAIVEGTTTKVNLTTIKSDSLNIAGKVVIDPLFHTNLVRKGFKIGFILFIVSEVMFFFGFFWSFFHSSISPTIQIGAVWPPLDVDFITVKGFAIANTVILLTSGATLTVAHYAFELIPQNRNNLYYDDLAFTDNQESYEGILEELYSYLNNYIYETSTPEIYNFSFAKNFFSNDTWNDFDLREFQFVIPLNIFINPFSKYFERNLSIKDTESLIKIYINLMLDLTLILAIIFMVFQGTEYFISPVNINTGIYGSTFYMITGLHGAHVFIGTCFLFYCRTAIAPAKNFWTLFLLITNFVNYLFFKLANSLLSEKFSLEETDSEFYDEGNYEKIIEEINPVDHYGKFGIESFESAAWYWHFVDVVWIFVFGFIYVWSHLTVLELQ